MLTSMSDWMCMPADIMTLAVAANQVFVLTHR